MLLQSPARFPVCTEFLLLMLLGAAATAAGCAKKSTQDGVYGGRSGAAGAGGAGGGAGGMGGAPLAPCPVDGTWQMTSIACGTMDQTATWFMVVPNTAIVVTALPQGGCEMKVITQNADCRQVAVDTVVPMNSKAAWQINSQGITECFPEACSFVSVDGGADGGAADASGSAASDGGPTDATDAPAADAAAGDAPAGDAPAGDAPVGDARDAGATDAGIATPCKVGAGAGLRPADTIVVSGDFFTATAPAPAGMCRQYGMPQVTRWMRKE